MYVASAQKMITHILTLSELTAPVSLCIKATNAREKKKKHAQGAHFRGPSVHVLHYTQQQKTPVYI